MKRRKSSFHYGKGNLGFCAHNDRSKPTANSIFDKSKNEYSCSAKEAIEIYRQELQKRMEAYTRRKNKKLNKNTITHLSAIVNLEQHHTLQDVKKVAQYLEQELGTKVFQIAVHKDEGYVDEDGTPHINYHAHLEFMGLDQQGNSVRRKLDKPMLSHLQDKVAQILQMERGTNYIKERKKRPKRLDTYVYKAHAKKLAEALKPYDKAILNAYLQYKLQSAKDPRAYKDFILQKLAERDESFVEELEAYKEYITQTDPQNFVCQEVERIAKVKDLKEENKRLREQLKEQMQQKEQELQLQLQPKPEPQAIEKEDTAKIEQLQRELQLEKAKNAELTGLLAKQEEEIASLKQQLQELKQLRYIERKQKEEEIEGLREKIKEAKKELGKIQEEQNPYQNQEFLAKMRIGELVQRWKELTKTIDDHFHDLSEEELQQIQREIYTIEEELKQYGIGLHSEEPKAPKKSQSYGRGMGF